MHSNSKMIPNNSNMLPFGGRLLPMVVDELAIQDPNRVYGSYATSNYRSDGFRNISMAQLAHSVNHTAWWIHEHIGTSHEFETIAYMGASDFRYPVFILAAIKCGFKVGDNAKHSTR